jgi:hypothetical protein
MHPGDPLSEMSYEEMARRFPAQPRPRAREEGTQSFTMRLEFFWSMQIVCSYSKMFRAKVDFSAKRKPKRYMFLMEMCGLTLQ